MRRVAVISLGILIAGVALSPDPASADDAVVGAVWEITYKVKGKADIVKKFRATPDFKVYAHNIRQDKLGTWSGTNDKAKLDITELTGDNAKGNGVYEIVLVKKDPPTWGGKFTQKSGKEFPIIVKMVKD